MLFDSTLFARGRFNSWFFVCYIILSSFLLAWILFLFLHVRLAATVFYAIDSTSHHLLDTI